MIDQAVANLKPGGHFEAHELAPGFYRARDDPSGARTFTYDPSSPMSHPPPLRPSPPKKSPSARPASALDEWAADRIEASQIVSRPIDFAPRLAQSCRDAGLVNVQEHVFRIPVGPWPRDARLRDLGAAWRQTILQGLSGDSIALFDAAWSWNVTEIQGKLTEVRKELMHPDTRAYNCLYVVWGKKPIN